MLNPTPSDCEKSANSGMLENTGPLEPKTAAFSQPNPIPSAAHERPQAGGIIRMSNCATIASAGPVTRGKPIEFTETACVASRRKFPVGPPGVTVAGAGLLP